MSSRTLSVGITLFVLCSGLSAQVSTGTITGLVTDSSGAATPHAQVRVLNVDTNVVRESVTDSAGIFLAPNLLPGNYRVEVSLAGFQPQSKVGLVLALDQTLAVDFSLQLGEQKQAVTVVGLAQQLVQTATSSLGDVITEKPVQELPLNGRNFQNLIGLTAGVQSGPQGSFSQNLFNINGGRGSANGFMIDGLDVSSPSSDPIRVAPNLEAIGEFKIATSNFSAEYGRSMGGIINTHIRSGTNAFHGSAFEFLRNTHLDARNFFDVTLAPYHFNQFGGSAGGPILKDKLFIFGDYQGVRTRQSSTVLTNIPTPAETVGNFSALLPGTVIYNPSVFPRTPYPNNVIPLSQINPPSALMFSLFPQPNSTGAFNFVKAQGAPGNTDSGDGRVDYNLTNKDRISGVVTYNNSNTAYVPLLGSRLNGNLITTIAVQNERSSSLNYTRILNPATVNEIFVGYTRDVFFGPPSPGMQYEPNAGVPGLNINPTDPHTTGFPLYDPVGYNVFGGPAGGPFNQTHNIPQFADNFSWIRGRHAFKAGFVARFGEYNLDQSLFPRGFYIYLPYETSNLGAGGNSLASALLGFPYEAEREIEAPFGERIKEYGAYFQDDFKLNKRLTLNLGVRWDLYMPPTEEHNRIGNFDLATKTILLAGVNGESSSTVPAHYDNFSPHLGFAYQATGDSKTVVRGGFGIGFLPLVYTSVGTTTDRLMENPPFELNTVSIYAPFTPPPAGSLVSNGLPVTAQNPQNLCCGVGVITIPNQPNPYTEQWNLDVQRALPGNFLADVAYVGTHGVHLGGAVNLNQAPPGATASPSPISTNVSTVEGLLNHEDSIYHALQVKLERRFSSGMYLLAAYTFSKSIDNGSAVAQGSNASTPQPQDARDWRAERGLSDFDASHRLVLSYIYELPFGKGRSFMNSSNRAIDAVFGGWQVNGITTAQSGMPFTPTLSSGSAAINAGPGGAVRPDLIGNPILSNGQSVNDWFNVAAFTTPGKLGTAPYTFGNAGRNIIRGPDEVNFDFSLFKSFAVTEHAKLQFRSEFFNIFNHANFGLPNAAVDTAQAGFITSTVTGPRLVQFALKLLF